MTAKIPVSQRAAGIEYAIRDVVVPATELEKQGHRIIKLNIGDPLAYEGFPTPAHMVEAVELALRDQKNGYSPSYGVPELRDSIAEEERKNQTVGGNVLLMMSMSPPASQKPYRSSLPLFLSLET